MRHREDCHRVAFLLPDQYWGGSVSLIADALTGVNYFIDQYDLPDKKYQLCLMHQEGYKPRSMTGFAYESVPLQDERYDIVIVPAIWSITPSKLKAYGHFSRWLKAQDASNAHFLSITNGAFFLADAGLLDGQELTIHWAFKDLFQSLYKHVKLRSDLKACYTGRFWSSSGISPTLDLLYQLIRKFSGESMAQRCAKHFMLDESAKPEVRSVDVSGRDNLVMAIRDWINRHYSEPVNGADLAELFNMSYRNLNRRFSSETGLAVYEYLQKVRLDKAARLLLNSSMNVHQIAMQVGFSSQNSFARSFKKQFDRSPTSYRKFMKDL